MTSKENDAIREEREPNVEIPTKYNLSASTDECIEKATNEEKSKRQINHGIQTVPFYRLFVFADSMDITLMMIGTAAAIANGVSMPLMAVVFGNLIDSFGRNMESSHVIHEVSRVILEFVYLGLATGAASFLQVACWMVSGARQAARMRKLYLKAILRQDISYYDSETNAGEVVERMSGNIIIIQDAIGEKVAKFIQLLAAFLGGFMVAFVQGWLLSLVVMCIIPLLILSTGIMSSVIAKMVSRGQTAYSEAAMVVDQTITSMRTVASFTGEVKTIIKYKKSLKKAYRATVQEGLAAGLGLGSAYAIIFFGYSLGVWFGTKMILNKGYNGGRVISVMFALFSGSFSLGQASPCLSAFRAGQAAASNMFQTMDRRPIIDSYNRRGKIPAEIQGDIQLTDITFSYPARPETKILNHFYLSVPKGNVMALVGQSGCGKSTIINLIQRFYDPQGGEVRIDGINIKEYQLKWLREKMGLVSQEPVLFASSIKDNIAYGKENATDEEIKAAAELSNATKFIVSFPNGLDTIVGDRGTQLSGGQKQRIAIARAILKDPHILLLDEATSALDTESERIVQEALEKIMINRTTLIVAHRLTTVRNADNIVVIQGGSVVEKGSHQELIRRPNGSYSQLVVLQGQTTGHTYHQSMTVDRNLRINSAELSYENYTSHGVAKQRSECNIKHHSSRFFPQKMEINTKRNEVTQSASTAQSQKHHIPIWHLIHLNKQELPIILLGVIAAVGNGVILPIFGMMLSSIVQIFYKAPQKLQTESRLWSLVFIILGLASVVIVPTKTYLFAIAGSKLIERIRSMCFKKVINMEIGWFDDIQNSSGAIGAKLSTDATAVRGLVGDSLSFIVQNIATFAAGLAFAFCACWQLAFVMLGLVPIIGLNGWIQMKFMKEYNADAKVMYEEGSQVANEAVGNIRTVASFSAEEKVMKSYEDKCEGPIKAEVRKGVISGIGFGFSYLVLFCAYAISFYAGARLIQNNKTTFTEVFRVFFALNMAAASISQSSSLVPDASKAKSAASSVFMILDRKSLIDPSCDAGVTLQQIEGEVEFQHVSFTYPMRPDMHIFQDLSFSLHPGKTVALVGESGSGKSTVLSLLQRFYDPDSGGIFVDGIDIRNFNLHWLRRQIGAVNQELILFNDTVHANIAYGKEDDATEAEIISAAISANAHTFISGLPKGYETLVGERGIQLSGGQKQRVAIARVILKDPRILLLDEATSALDSEMERTVQDSLDKVMVRKTTLIVAHRLSTIKAADKILVIKNGHVVETGNHDALLSIKDGIYASMVASDGRSCSLYTGTR